MARTPPTPAPVRPSGLRQCQACNNFLPGGCSFRPEDTFCSLCGQQILYLQVEPATPDNEVWLYLREDTRLEDTRLIVAWQRRLEGRPARASWRPALELARSTVRFSCDRRELEFLLEEDASADGSSEAAVLRLMPCFPDLDSLVLPREGVPGQLTLAWDGGQHKGRVRLLPLVGKLRWSCTDPAVKKNDGVWYFERRSTTVVLPWRLVAPVPLYVLRVRAEPSPVMAVEGIDPPVLLAAKRPYQFHLRVDTSAWKLRQPVPFQLTLRVLGLHHFPPVADKLALLPPSGVEIGSPNPQELEVALGQSRLTGFTLTACEGAAAGAEALTIKDYKIHLRHLAGAGAAGPAPPGGPVGGAQLATQPPVGDGWLRVVWPDKKKLPLPVGTRRPDPPLPPGGPPSPASQQAVDVGGSFPPPEGSSLSGPTRDPLVPETEASIDVKSKDDETLNQLVLEIDTSRLNREHYADTLLEGEVALLDQRQRVWPCRVRVTLTRFSPLDHYLAIDWGTTNSCAAYSVGVGGNHAPHAVPFDETQLYTPELFPSDLYFKDLSDPSNPIVYVGYEAVHRAEHMPQCCLRSVKRKLQFKNKVFVRDEQERPWTYSVTEVVRFLLQKLVALAEANLKREIRNLGLTFPTKWTARTRRKLEEVAKELADHLGQVHRPFRVDVQPPQVDEANAVVVHLMTMKDTPDLPETFTLIVYDFGGGTVDTSLLKVHLPEDLGEATTRYLGIGGRGDFGGDDVTRAVLLLLHQRLTKAMEGRDVPPDGTRPRPAQVKAIPLVEDGESLEDSEKDSAQWHQLGRANWEVLWKIAEAVKVGLCDADAALGHEQHASRQPAGNPVKEQLETNLSRISCRLEGSANGSPVQDPCSLFAVINPLDADALDHFYKDLSITLDEVCTFPLPDLYGTNNGRRFTVHQFIEDTIQELQWQWRDHLAASGPRQEAVPGAAAVSQPDIIMLAGGGCRLPLIARLMRRYFPSEQTRLFHRADFAKRRVAYGMANYLRLRLGSDIDRRLARSVDVIHHHLGLQRTQRSRTRGVEEVFEPIVRVGTPIDSATTWHSFAFRPSHVVRNPNLAPGVERPLWLFLLAWPQEPKENRPDEPEGSAVKHGAGVQLGYFDLDRLAGPLGLEKLCAGEPLPPLPAGPCDGALRLCGAGCIELRVTLQGQLYGPYRLVPTVPDIETALQH